MGAKWNGKIFLQCEFLWIPSEEKFYPLIIIQMEHDGKQGENVVTAAPVYHPLDSTDTKYEYQAH